MTSLRPTETADLEHFFIFQLDGEANYIAAFTWPHATNKAAYIEKYTKLLATPTVNMQTIWEDGIIAGSISKFEIDGEAEITYWIDRKLWGRGITSSALKDILTIEPMRPITGRVAFDNIGSQKVLEKCGFIKIGRDEGFANARQAVIEEFIYKLD